MTLRTIDDADRLRHRLRASSRLLVVGGGWIGLEVASTARQLGVDVTLIEAAAQLCTRSLPARVAQLVETLHKKNGVRILLDRKIRSAAQDAKGEIRSEEHTSELQSLRRRSYAVFCLK